MHMSKVSVIMDHCYDVVQMFQNYVVKMGVTTRPLTKGDH